jgi:lipopolysaccharide transport system ATP-binding protein
VKIISVSVIGDGKPKAIVSIDRPIQFVVEFETLNSGLELSVSFHLVHPTAGIVFTTANFASASVGGDEWIGKKFPKGQFRSTCTLPGNFLNDGTFLVNVVILRSVRETEVFLPEVLQFTAEDTGGMRKEFKGHWVGTVRPLLPWKTELLVKTA